MVKESWGKKHVCPFCGAIFYDMKKEVVVCPKCNKPLSLDDELEFIKKKKKAEALEEEKLEQLDGVEDGVVDISESEMFFDMDNEETISKSNYYDEDEDKY